jgi:putative hydrolase
VTDVPQPGDPEDGESRPDPFSGSGPFGLPEIPGLDFSQLDIAQVMRLLQSEGPVNWEIARQIAGYVALDGAESEPPVSSKDREELEELARAAESHVVAETGLASVLGLRTAMMGRREWADLHLDALRPVLEALAITLRQALEAGDDPTPSAETHPSGASPFGFAGGADPFGGILTMLAPLLLGVQAGSMVGYLGQHALGRYDLPLPTDDEPSLAFVVPNLAAFEEAWSLERRDLRFAVALHEVVHAAERSVPWVRERLVRLAIEYVSAYEMDSPAFEQQFGSIDPSDPSSFAGIAENPEALLGAMQSERQVEILTRVQGLTMVLEGYADVVIERLGTRLLPDFARIHEAMQRHHVERGEAERFIEQLLGLRLDRDHYEKGEAFCRGVIERSGLEGLNRLWESERMLPTPSELDAPGLWLARIDLPDMEG